MPSALAAAGSASAMTIAKDKQPMIVLRKFVIPYLLFIGLFKLIRTDQCGVQPGTLTTLEVHVKR